MAHSVSPIRQEHYANEQYVSKYAQEEITPEGYTAGRGSRNYNEDQKPGHLSKSREDVEYKYSYNRGEQERMPKYERTPISSYKEYSFKSSVDTGSHVATGQTRPSPKPSADTRSYSDIDSRSKSEC